MQYISFYKNKKAEKRRHARIKQNAQKRALAKRKKNWWQFMMIKANALLPVTMFVTHVDYTKRTVTGIGMNKVGHTADETLTYRQIRKMGKKIILKCHEDKIKELKKEVYGSTLNPYRKIKDIV